MEPTTQTQSVVLITGSAQRVGRGIALDLASHGHDIIVHYKDSADEAAKTVTDIQALGQRAAMVQADLGDSSAMQGLMDDATAALGPVTGLIHNASLFEKDSLGKAEVEVTVDSWRNHQVVNVESPMLLTQAFAKALPDSISGQVICLLDGMRNWSISPVFFSYSASRLGMGQAIPLMAESLAPSIRVNGIALGATLEGEFEKEQTFEKVKQMAPLQRLSSVGEVCDAVRFILSASGVTGQVIDLTGGMSL